MSALPAAGDRIQITGLLPNDPAPMPIGSSGTVTDVLNPGTPYAQIVVAWDDGYGLMLLPGDPFTILKEDTHD